MHELAVTESVLQAITERLGDAKILRVRLVVGQLTAILPDAMRFAFEACTLGTPLEGAELEIDETGGNELLIKEVEVA